MSDQAPEIKVKITGEDTGVSAAIKELSLQLQQLKRTQDEAGSSAKNLGTAEAGAGRSMREARESARLLSEETGVHLSRGLTGVLAKSTTLGPILNAAFPAAAAIGFIAVIASGTEKLTALIANTFIYSQAMQEEYAAQVKTNNEIQKGNDMVGPHAHTMGVNGADSTTMVPGVQRLAHFNDDPRYGAGPKKVTDNNTGSETRPKNVALLYCILR